MSPRKNAPDSRDFVESATFVIVGAVLGIVPLLLFFFSFGNVGLLGTSLGVDHWIAFLTGPAVDLAVAGCVIASSYLSTRGWTERQLWPLHTAATVCGLVMILLNTGGAVYSTRWRLAAFDSVGPLMLVGWGLLAPWLWRNLTEARRGATVRPSTVHRDRPTVQPKTDRPAAPTVQPTHSQPSTATAQNAPRPSSMATAVDGAPTIQPSRERWAEVGRTVYERLADEFGKRPPEKPFRDALAAEAERLIAAGQLSESYANPSLSTAKRARADIEAEPSDHAPLHPVPERDREAS